MKTRSAILSACLLLLASAPLFAQTNGGPDAYGYTWVSSHNLTTAAVNDANLHSWTDISASGTAITGFSDDNVLGPFPIGFSFPYYWNNYTEFYLGSNGYLMFGRAINIGSDVTGFPVLPTAGTASAPSNYLAPFMCDLTFTDKQGVTAPGAIARYATQGDSCIISYTNVPFWTRTNAQEYQGLNTFQIVLHSNGNISYNYLTQEGEVDPTYVATGTTYISRGIENIAGTDGLNMGNNFYPVASSSIRFTYPTSTSFEIRDVATSWVFNSQNAGVFLSNSNTPYTVQASIQNTGNLPITASTPVTVSVQVTDYSTNFFENVNSLASELVLTELAVGQTQLLTFPVSIPASLKPNAREQRYRVKVRAVMSGDEVALNNDRDAQLIIVDTTRTQGGVLLAHDRFPYSPQPQVWDRAIGGNDGFISLLHVGNYFQAPFYPCYVHGLEFGIVAFSNGEAVPDTIAGYRTQLLDATGPNGTPGTVRATIEVGRDNVVYGYDYLEVGDDFEEFPAISTNRHWLDTPILINSNGFYVSWQLQDSDPNWLANAQNVLGTDGQLFSPFSYANYEISGGIWAPYRNRPNEDFAIRAIISNSPAPLNRKAEVQRLWSVGKPYPQPVTLQSSRLPFRSERTTKVQVQLFNIKGQQVASLPTQILPAGEHVLELPTQGLAPGTYVYRVSAAQGTQSGRIVVQ